MTCVRERSFGNSAGLKLKEPKVFEKMLTTNVESGTWSAGDVRVRARAVRFKATRVRGLVASQAPTCPLTRMAGLVLSSYPRSC